MRLKFKYTKAIITAIVLGLFIWYFFNNKEQLKEILSINPLYLVPIVFIQYLTMVFNGLFIKQILDVFEKRISLIESFYISTISSIGNYFGPFLGGAGVRAVYLKKKHKLPYSHFMATLSGNYVIVILLNAALGLVALAFLQPNMKDVNTMISILFLLGMLMFSGLFITIGVPKSLIVRIKSNSKIPRVSKIISQMSEGWNEITSNKKLLLELSLLTVINFILSVLLVQVELAAIGLNLGLWNAVFYSVLGTVSLFLSFTPGALGIKEAVLVFASSIIGLTGAEIFALAVIDRGIRFLVLGTGWLASSYVKKIRGY